MHSWKPQSCTVFKTFFIVKSVNVISSQLCNLFFFSNFLILIPHKPSLITSLSHGGPRLCILYIILLKRPGPCALTSSTSSYIMNYCTWISLALLSEELHIGSRHNLLLEYCQELFSNSNSYNVAKESITSDVVPLQEQCWTNSNCITK